MWVIVVLIVLIVVVGGVAIAQYNGLVRLRNKLQESWRQVDVELNRRYDLVPNLVSTVQGSAKFEQSTLERVIALRNQARAMATGGGDTTQRSQVEGELTRAIGNIMVTAEAYPELKSTAGFQQLQGQLSQTEDRIANARRYYNAIVGDYNTKTESFPSSIFAGMFHFTKAGYFEVDDPSIRQAPTVDFNQLNGVPSAPQPVQPPQVNFDQPPTLPPYQQPPTYQ
ncbi:MAG: LemA family protein [Propionibacteriaceae bacterium]|nr:LemA family protein [Propionibacteriaceae bacterium]